MRTLILGLAVAIVGFACSGGASDVDDDDGSGGTGAGGSGAGAGGQLNTCIEDEPATQTVTFTLTNDTTTDRFVAIEADQCAPWGLAQEEEGVFQPYPMGTGYPCGCECAAPPPAHVTAYQRIPAGGSFDYVWDARRRMGCSYTEDCGDGFTATVPGGFMRPVGGGQYRVTFGVEETLDVERCLETIDAGYWRCDFSDQDATGQNGVCTSSTMIDVDFLLETAAVTVPVLLL